MKHQHIENVYTPIDKKAFLKKAFNFPISNVKKEFFEKIYHITSAWNFPSNCQIRYLNKSTTIIVWPILTNQSKAIVVEEMYFVGCSL